MVNVDAIGGTSRPWQALLMSPKGRNASRDGFVNLNISLNSIASFGNLTPVGLALLFCFSLIRRSLSIVTTWNQQTNIYIYSIWKLDVGLCNVDSYACNYNHKQVCL